MCTEIVQKTKSCSEVAGILSSYRKSSPVSVEEMDQAIQDYIRQRAARTDRETFQQVLINVPETDVISGDEIPVKE